MKLVKNILILFAISSFIASCEKNEITYNTTPVTDQAEFQLHYMVPVTAVASNNIYKVEINGELYANKTAPLNTYNAVPSGGVGRFYTARPGKMNIKLYRGDNLEQVYDQDCDVKVGKQNIVVYDFAKPPVVLDNLYPYERFVTEETGKHGWVRFYNFMFESGTTTTPLVLQYQFQYTIDNATGQKSDWINVGSPVAFGEATEWIPINVNKGVENSSGSARVDYRIMTVNNDGSLGAQLEVRNSAGNMVNYTDWWTTFIGRYQHHFFAGMRTAAPIVGVRVFYAL